LSPKPKGPPYFTAGLFLDGHHRHSEAGLLRRPMHPLNT
jgi:hypothetical protein